MFALNLEPTLPRPVGPSSEEIYGRPTTQLTDRVRRVEASRPGRLRGLDLAAFQPPWPLLSAARPIAVRPYGATCPLHGSRSATFLRYC